MHNLPDNPLPPYWLSYESGLSKHRTTDELPSEADVVIIGSGYSGAAAAYHILEKDDGHRPSVVVLEARDTCSGATGRNGGHLKPASYSIASYNEKTYGTKMARRLLKFEFDQVWDVKRLIEKESIDCDFVLTRGMDVYTNPEVADATLAAFEALKSDGFDFPDDLYVVTDPQKAEQISGVKGALLLFSFTAGSVWPYKLISHLWRRCLEWGANLQTFTPVLSLDKSSNADGRWILKTTRGTIAAKKVLLATNAYTSSLIPEMENKITPVRGVACRIATPGDGKLAPHLNNTYSIRFGPQEYDYLIPRTDGSIVVGGAKQVLLRDDDNWRDNVNDSQMISGAEEYFDNYMQRTFSGWEESGARVTDIWTGIMGYAADLKPYVGEVPDKPGVFISAGFTGHGMPQILGCSTAVAALIRGDVPFLEATNLPRPFWLTRERLQSDANLVRGYMAGSRPSRS